MDVQDTKIRWNELVKDLVAASSKTNLASTLGVNPKEVNRWLKGDARPQGDNAQKLLNQAEYLHINWHKYAGLLPMYDIRTSFEANVIHGPQGVPKAPETVGIPNIPTRVCGFKLNSPLGVPASVLTINAQWIEPLTRLGFDIITYKTIRTNRNNVVAPHSFPNILCVPQCTKPLSVGERIPYVKGVPDFDTHDITSTTLANSFGMPSQVVSDWQEDMKKALSLLRPGQMLIASVVGTEINEQEEGLVSDFVTAARLAAEVKPHALELNFSCPNVYNKQEGSIHHNPTLAGEIVKKVRNHITGIPIFVKIGYLTPVELRRFFDATYKDVDGYTAINTLSVKLLGTGQREEAAFSGRLKAGISGVAIRSHALEVVRELKLLTQKKSELAILGVGGISSVEHVREFMDLGATAVQICTAALLNPFIAAEIRKQLDSQGYSYPRSKFASRSGATIPFSDAMIANAFDSTAELCSELSIPFEQAFVTLQKHWLNAYLKDISTSEQTAGAALKTRRTSPSKQEIANWLRSEQIKL